MSELNDEINNDTNLSSRQTTIQSWHWCCDNLQNDPQNTPVLPDPTINILYDNQQSETKPVLHHAHNSLMQHCHRKGLVSEMQRLS